jgi:hypothetical protein
MVLGAADVVERALQVGGLGEVPVWVPGLLSRKKQVVAPLMDVAASGVS